MKRRDNNKRWKLKTKSRNHQTKQRVVIKRKIKTTKTSSVSSRLKTSNQNSHRR